jgi:hypothetical protein
MLYAACIFDVRQAVDEQQVKSTGLVNAIGQDAVQAILAKAFRPVR